MAEENVIIETTEVPLEEASMSEYKQAMKDGKDVATRETVTEKPVEEKDEKPRARGGFQAKIDRLVKAQAALEEEKAATKKENEELKAKLNGNSTKKEGAEPAREDFQSDAEYMNARIDWGIEQGILKAKEKEQRQSIEAQISEARGRYNTRMIALKAEDPEVEELLNQDIKVPTSLEGPVTLEMDNGADVAVFLARNPEICEELTKMKPSEAIAEAWAISKKLAKGIIDDDEPEEIVEKEPKEKAVEEKPKVRPIRPVSSGSSRSTIPLDKSDFAAYKKLRAQGRVQ